jgi:hypothetical protein
LLKLKIDKALGKNKYMGTPKRRPDSNFMKAEALMYSKTANKTQVKNI